jgi:hypothetical protein
MNPMGKRKDEGYWVSGIPRMTPIARRLWRTEDNVIWDDGDEQFTVPAGWITDGASLPWPLLAIWDRMDPQTLRASILHDYGYSTHAIGSKAIVDRRFYDGLVAANWPNSKTYYQAVKWFGWYAWNIQRNVDQKTNGVY